MRRNNNKLFETKKANIMTYFLQNNGFIRKTYLRILNVFMIFAIPFGTYNNMKYNKMYNFKVSWQEQLKEEFKIWLDGFIFGE